MGKSRALGVIRHFIYHLFFQFRSQPNFGSSFPVAICASEVLSSRVIGKSGASRTCRIDLKAFGVCKKQQTCEKWNDPPKNKSHMVSFIRESNQHRLIQPKPGQPEAAISPEPDACPTGTRGLIFKLELPAHSLSPGCGSKSGSEMTNDTLVNGTKD